MTLLVFLILLWLVCLTRAASKLKARVAQLEAQVRQQPNPVPTVSAALPTIPTPESSIPPAANPAQAEGLPPAPIVVQSSLPKLQPVVSQPNTSKEEASWLATESPFMCFVRRNAFAVAGIALLLLGFTYLLSSIQWGNLLPPAAKIGLAWAASGGLAALGIRLGRRNALWGELVQGGAAGIAYLATYVAAEKFNILPDFAALGGFALISAWTVHRAWVQDAKMLAAVGFLGAYTAPVLALTHPDSLWLTLTYGLITTAAALWVSLKRQWLELAVHAHLCAAGMAALVYMRPHDPLPVVAQQVLLNAYFGQFTAWVVAWALRYRSTPKQAAVLAACLGLSAISYLGLQHWLLSSVTFTLVSSTVASIAASALLRFPKALQREVREAIWLVIALFATSAIFGAHADRGVVGLTLIAEAAIMLLTADSQVRIRIWIARALAVVGAFLAIGHTSIWVNGVLLALCILLSWRLEKGSRSADATLFTIFGLGATLATASSITAHYHPLTIFKLSAAAQMFATSFLGVAAAGSAAAAVLSTMQSKWCQARAYHWMLVLAWITLAALPERLLNPSAAGLLMHCALVALVPLAALAVSAHRAQRTPDSGLLDVAVNLSVVCSLLPTVVAYKYGVSATGLMAWAVTGLAGWSALVHTVLANARTFTGARVTNGLRETVDVVSLVLGVSILMPLRRDSVLLDWSTAESLALLACSLAGIATWTFSRIARRPAVRTTVGAFFASLLAIVWLEGMPLDAAWREALKGMALPLVWGVIGVGLLIYYSRKGVRPGWQAAAAGCALATIKLLAVVGGALLSPLGVALSLLGMGALLLLAGYIAPQPPSSDRTS